MVNLSVITNRVTTSKMKTGQQRLLLSVSILLCTQWLGGATAMANSSLLSGDNPETMQVDILPGNADNSINLRTQRKIPIAILGSARLDVTDINPRTLSLEATSQNLVGKSDKSLCEQRDINADSYMDLVCEVKTIGFRVQPGDIDVVINVGTYQRLSLRAVGTLRYLAD